MNPLTNVKNITKLNEIELARGTKKSWHDIYKNSAWIFIGGLPYGLTEGDILAVFSQYGEIVNINLVRDKKTGKTKGYCFLCYANQKSTVLAVDNFNGIKLCNRTIRVDHVADYKPPKEDERDDEITKILKSEGCAPKNTQMDESNTMNNSKHEKKKKVKKEKKEKKKKKRKHKSDESDADPHVKKVKIKEEKYDPGYDKYDTSRKKSISQKEPCQERSSDKSFGEHSAHEKHRSEIPEKFHKNKGKSHERKNMQCKSNSDEERSKYKRKQESTSHGKRSIEEDKEYKRYSSSGSSSDDISDSYSSEDDIRCQNEKKHVEDKSHRHKRKDKRDCNASKYEDSSSESSSEKHKSQSGISEKENYKTHGEKNTSEHKNKDKHSHRRESFDDETFRKDRHYSKDEKYSDDRSRSKYKNESSYRHSIYHKKDKQDKR